MMKKRRDLLLLVLIAFIFCSTARDPAEGTAFAADASETVILEADSSLKTDLVRTDEHEEITWDLIKLQRLLRKEAEG